MYALFDDAGRFLAGRVMSETDASMQVELDSGKRVKVKSANVLLRFGEPAPAELIAEGQRLAHEIDLDLAWQFAPDSDFGFADLAREYFEPSAGPAKQAAALFRLFDAPHYFRRVGKGLFRKAPEEQVNAALLAIERKRAQAEQVGAWAAELIDGACPPPIREQLYRILFKPDKQSVEYKAVVEAARRAQRSPLDLLAAAGAIASPYQFHWRRFLFEQFPHGTAFPASLQVPSIAEALPLAEGVAAFSIDDSATTEIDDALSVRGIGSGVVTFGIHIAAPALAFAPDSAVDKVARERLSTVYVPGWKITMLPDDIVAAYTLTASRDCAAVSLYLTIDEATLEVRGSQTRLERVPIVANLRHDKLDAIVTEASLEGTSAPADYAFAAELAFAFRLARACKARREIVRGRPENFSRPDYAFRLAGPRIEQGVEPDGSEDVSIAPRLRGAPLDLIVAEAMILANSTWGGWLDDCGVPGIYRSQASLAPGVKVRMGTKALPHAGIGVAQYCWATSPLRRYVDLVNQWQIVACARHGRTAPLAAPFKPKDAALYSVVSAFDAAYAAYGDIQQAMERFWTLRWLQQHEVDQLDATVLRDALVRADKLPLVMRATGADGLPRGTRVRVRVADIDLLSLDLHASVVERIDDAAMVRTAADDAGEDEEDAAAAAPIALAIDVADADAAPAAEAAP